MSLLLRKILLFKVIKLSTKLSHAKRRSLLEKIHSKMNWSYLPIIKSRNHDSVACMIWYILFSNYRVKSPWFWSLYDLIKIHVDKVIYSLKRISRFMSIRMFNMCWYLPSSYTYSMKRLVSKFSYYWYEVFLCTCAVLL